jgi:hypothetical protein
MARLRFEPRYFVNTSAQACHYFIFPTSICSVRNIVCNLNQFRYTSLGKQTSCLYCQPKAVQEQRHISRFSDGGYGFDNWRIVLRFPVGTRNYCPHHIFWLAVGPRSLLFKVYRAILLPQQSNQSVNLTNHFHLVPRLKMNGAKPPLPAYAFMGCARITYA